MLLKAVYTSLITLIFTTLVTGQVMWQVTGNRVVRWNYADGDEFSGNNIDTSKWLDAYPWGRNLYCSQDDHYYTEFKNCEQSNGILRLIAKREKITARAVPYEPDNYKLVCDGKNYGVNLRTFDYTSGMIFSKKKYHYGYFEIRFRSAQGSGLWPAFWLYAGHENDEIDIFEINGSRNRDMHVDVHCPKGCNNYKTTLGLLRKNWGDYLTTSASWNSGYNIIAAEWQPDYVKWFLNGNPVAYWKGKFQHPMWVIADMAISRNNGPFGPGPDGSTVFPASLDIDYIRIWTQKSSGSEKKITSIFDNPSLNKNASTLVTAKKPESKKKYIKEKTCFLTLAPAGNNKYIFELCGEKDLISSFQVTDSKGEIIYNGNNSKLIHQFEVTGRSTIKISTIETSFEYSF